MSFIYLGNTTIRSNLDAKFTKGVFGTLEVVEVRNKLRGNFQNWSKTIVFFLCLFVNILEKSVLGSEGVLFN